MAAKVRAGWHQVNQHRWTYKDGTAIQGGAGIWTIHWPISLGMGNISEGAGFVRRGDAMDAVEAGKSLHPWVRPNNGTAIPIAADFATQAIRIHRELAAKAEADKAHETQIKATVDLTGCTAKRPFTLTRTIGPWGKHTDTDKLEVRGVKVKLACGGLSMTIPSVTLALAGRSDAVRIQEAAEILLARLREERPDLGIR